MFQFNLIEKPKFNTEEKILDSIFKNISNIVPETQNWILNIVFVDENSIQKLNNDYRNKDSVTDVLSFHYYEDFSDLEPEEVAWEIILCETKIYSQWKEYWLGTEYEFYKLIIHSVLHILWYDHELDDEYKIMQDLEDKIWHKVFEK